MANTLYDKGRERFLVGQFNWQTDTLKVLLVDTGAYTPNFGTHEFLSDIPTSARVGTSTGVVLTSKTTSGGAADAADITFSSVSGPSIEALIAYIDTATGLPITPNGGDIIVTWDNGANKIFKL